MEKAAERKQPEAKECDFYDIRSDNQAAPPAEKKQAEEPAPEEVAHENSPPPESAESFVNLKEPGQRKSSPESEQEVQVQVEHDEVQDCEAVEEAAAYGETGDAEAMEETPEEPPLAEDASRRAPAWGPILELSRAEEAQSDQPQKPEPVCAIKEDRTGGQELTWVQREAIKRDEEIAQLRKEAENQWRPVCEYQKSRYKFIKAEHGWERRTEKRTAAKGFWGKLQRITGIAKLMKKIKGPAR